MINFTATECSVDVIPQFLLIREFAIHCVHHMSHVHVYTGYRNTALSCSEAAATCVNSCVSFNLGVRVRSMKMSYFVDQGAEDLMVATRVASGVERRGESIWEMGMHILITGTAAKC